MGKLTTLLFGQTRHFMAWKACAKQKSFQLYLVNWQNKNLKIEKVCENATFHAGQQNLSTLSRLGTQLM